MGKKKAQTKSIGLQLAQNRTGLQGLPKFIDQNFQSRNRWTLIQDFQEFRSVTVNLCIKLEATLENMRNMLIKALSEGQWLVLNFGFMNIDITPFSHKNFFPTQVLNPILIFMQSTIDRIKSSMSEELQVKDEFRVIVVSKNANFEESLAKNFAFCRIDQDIVKDQIREAKLAAKKKANVKMQKLNEDLFEACFEGQLDKVQQYMEDGADPEYRDPHLNFPLSEAALKGHFQVVQHLLTYQQPGVDPNQANQSGKTALHKAAFNGHFKIVQLLLNYGADPRIKDQQATTPLQTTNNSACKTTLMVWDIEQTDRIIKQRQEQILLREQLGVQNQEKNKKKERQRIKAFLVQCAQNGKFVEIQEIIQNGQAIVDTRDANGNSLLSLACINNHFECVRRLLIVLDANINTRDNRGWTPLAISSHHGHAKIVRLLLQRGADPDIPNNRNKFPIQLAKSSQIKQIIEKRFQLKNSTKFEYMLEDAVDPLESQDESSEEQGNLNDMPKPGDTLYQTFYSPSSKKKKTKKLKKKKTKKTLNTDQSQQEEKMTTSISSFEQQDSYIGNLLKGTPLDNKESNIIPNFGYYTGKKQDAICPTPPDKSSIIEIVKDYFLSKKKKKKVRKSSPYRRTPEPKKKRKGSRSKSPKKQDKLLGGEDNNKGFLRILPVNRKFVRYED